MPHKVRFKGELRESDGGVVLTGAIEEAPALRLCKLVFGIKFLLIAAAALTFSIRAAVDPAVSNAEIPGGILVALVVVPMGVWVWLPSPFEDAADELADLMRLLEQAPVP